MPCCKVADSWEVKGAGGERPAQHAELRLPCVQRGPLVSFCICLPAFLGEKQKRGGGGVASLANCSIAGLRGRRSGQK